MTDLILLLLVMEGLPLLAFIYYLEHKKGMYLLETRGARCDTLAARHERRLMGSLRLTLVGAALIVAPSIARMAGLEASLTFELLLVGIVTISGGLAMLLGYCVLRRRALGTSALD